MVGALLAVVAIVGACGPAVAPVQLDPPSNGTFRGGSDRPGIVAGNVATAPVVAWEVAGEDPVIASPVAAGPDRVVVATGDDELLAVDPSDGEVAWHTPVAATEASIAALGSHVVTVALDGTMATHDIGTGDVSWEIALGGRVRSSPLVADGLLVVGVGDAVVAVDAATGTERWRTAIGERVDGSAASDGEVLVIGDTANRLWGLELADGAERFVVDLGPLGEDTFVDGVAATPAIVDGRAFVGSTNGSVSAHDLATGAVAWTTTLHGPVYASMALAPGDSAFVATATGAVVALSRRDGTIAWEVDVGDAVYASPTYVDGDTPTLLVLEEGGHLVALDPADGTERWRRAIGRDGNYMASTPTVVDDTIIVGTNTGDLLGLR